MDFDSDFDVDSDNGGVPDLDDGCYGGDGNDYYHDDFDVGDFHVDVGVSGVDDFHDVKIHAWDDLCVGEDVEVEFGGDDRDLVAEIGIYGGGDYDGEVDIAVESGDYFDDIQEFLPVIEIHGGDYDIDVDGLVAAESGSNGGNGFDDDRDLVVDIGIDGGGDSDGGVDIALELGGYFDDSQEFIAGIEIYASDYDIDGDGLAGAESGSDGVYGFDDGRDFEARFIVRRGYDDDNQLLESGFEVSAEDIYGVDDDEAMTEYRTDFGAVELVPVVEVDDNDADDNGNSDDYRNYSGDDELVPGVEVADYYNGGSLNWVEDFVLNADNNTSTREITIQVSPSMNTSSNGASVGRNEGENDGNMRNKLKDGEMGSSSEEDKKDMNVNGSSENDGVSCSICLEPWTTDGDHIICCLPCGHVYGMSCIKSWLQQPNSQKCPLCNKACRVEGIRKIYGLPIMTAEKDLKEKIQLLEARCASLELNNADWQRKEAERLQSQAVLPQQQKSDTNN